MAALTRRMNEPCRRLAFALFFSTLLFHNGVVCQDAETATSPITLDDITGPPQIYVMAARGDGDPFPDLATQAPEAVAADSTNSTQDSTAGPADPNTDAGGQTIVDPTAGEDDSPQTAEAETAAPPEGDSLGTTAGSELEPTAQDPVDLDYTIVIHNVTNQHKGDVQCVDKDAVLYRDAVKLELKSTSTCEDTKARMKSVLGYLCEERKDCELEIFQEENSSHIIVSGQNIEADVKGMADKFSSDGIKDQLGVMEAVPHWGKHPPTVLVSLLLTGLLLAAVLIGGYCLKNHRGHHAKGIRLAEESFQVDEENQGNTLVSVAPLHPQEPQEKPSANGESPEGGKTQVPDTNGHSATKTPVADTEL